MSRLPLFFACVLVEAGCGKGTSNNNGTGGTTGDGGSGGSPMQCEKTDIAPLTQEATLLNGNLLNVISKTADAMRIDRITVQLFYDNGADPGPHTFTFTGEDYAECHTCVLAYDDCDAMDECFGAFLIQSGTLEVTENSMATAGMFAATLRDAVFIEVTVDPDTFVATPVVDGCRWAINSVPMNAAIVFADS